MRSWTNSSLIAFLILPLVLACPSQGADRLGTNLGKFSLDSFLLEPFFKLEEGQEVKMDLRQSYAKLAWEYKKNTRAFFSFGQKELLGTPSRFSATVVESSEFALVEAYGEFTGDYGTIRFGLLPLEFGLESGGIESQLTFSPSLIYQTRLVGRRDFGLRYGLKQRKFYSVLTVHNGESGAELDNRVWLTGKWGWRNGKSLNIGLGATTGETTPKSSAQPTSPSTDTVFDINENAKWRMANLFFSHAGSRFAVDLEILGGTVVQELAGKNDFYAAHADLLYKWTKNISLGLRYGYLEPDRKRSGDALSQAVFSVSLHNEHRTSRVFIEASTNLDRAGTIQDQLLVFWRLTSDSESPFAE